MGGKKAKMKETAHETIGKTGNRFSICCCVVFLFVVLILMYKEVPNTHFDPTFLMVNIQSSPQLQTLQKITDLSYVCRQFQKT